MSRINKINYDPVTKIWKGPDCPAQFNPNIGLGDLILRVLSNTPNRISQVNADNGKELTCNEIRSMTIRVFENLKRLGFKMNDIVSVASRNRWDLAPVIFGCLTNGIPVNTLDAMFGQAELSHMFEIVKPKAVFCELQNCKSVEDALDEVRSDAKLFIFGAESELNTVKSGIKRQFFWVNELFNTVPVNDEYYIAPKIADPENHIAAILCSSGTTGLSKGVCLSHSMCIAILQNMWSFPAPGDLVFLCFSSLYWISGFGCLVYTTLNGAKRVVTTDSFNPELQLKLIAKYKVNITMNPPSHLAQILASPLIKTTDLSSIKYACCGGSYVSDNLRIEFKKYIKNGDVYVAYGMTENAGMSHTTYPDNKPGTVGIPRPEMETKIINEDGLSLGPLQDGEICLRLPYKFLGYYGDEAQTKALMSDDGWIRTGDIGKIDNDGQLFFVERKKDMIRFLGYTSFPSEIEAMIQKVTGLTQVCVVGIEDYDSGNDFATVLIVKPNNCSLSEDNVVNLANEKLPDYKKIRGGCYFIDSLPLTPSGKVKRREAKVIASQLFKQSKRK